MIDILEENVHNAELESVLTEYLTPVTIEDEVMGEFVLDKYFKEFRRKLNWLGKIIGASFEVDIDDKESWHDSMSILRMFYDMQDVYDAKFRAYAAKELTELANDWRDDDEAPDEITEKDFAKRIILTNFCVGSEGNYSVWYEDGDMFYGHTVAVYGNIKTGIECAEMMG
jgi:hypothetical protein